MSLGLLQHLLRAGGRIHQAGCNGCIGMGQAPATGRISLRTVPRNFPGRSGTIEDAVYLCSPETATASALTGVITDPRTLGTPYPRFVEPQEITVNTKMLVPPDPRDSNTELEKGPNIKSLPIFPEMQDLIDGPVLIKLGDNVSTDTISPAGAKVLPYRSNIPAIANFSFVQVDEGYAARALRHQERGSIIVGGLNYGQGSSREHAALAPRFLGVRAVLAKSFARIHWQNLVNFGILPLTFVDPVDWSKISQDDVLSLAGARNLVATRSRFTIRNSTKNQDYEVEHRLSERQVEVLLAGGLINVFRKRHLPD